MREILFRGKKVHSDKWLYGVPVKGTEKDVNEMIMIANVFDQEGYCCRGCNLDPVIPETIGQYTGLTDKNGKKIFEGDRVKCNGDFGLGTIVYNSGSFAVEYDKPIKEEWRGTLLFCLINENGILECEVIGNIHDNPELLEDKT